MPGESAMPTRYSKLNASQVDRVSKLLQGLLESRRLLLCSDAGNELRSEAMASYCRAIAHSCNITTEVVLRSLSSGRFPRSIATCIKGRSLDYERHWFRRNKADLLRYCVHADPISEIIFLCNDDAEYRAPLWSIGRSKGHMGIKTLQKGKRHKRSRHWSLIMVYRTSARRMMYHGLVTATSKKISSRDKLAMEDAAVDTDQSNSGLSKTRAASRDVSNDIITSLTAATASRAASPDRANAQQTSTSATTYEHPEVSNGFSSYQSTCKSSIHTGKLLANDNCQWSCLPPIQGGGQKPCELPPLRDGLLWPSLWL